MVGEFQILIRKRCSLKAYGRRFTEVMLCVSEKCLKSAVSVDF